MKMLPYTVIVALGLVIAAAAWMSQSSALAGCGTCGNESAAHTHEPGHSHDHAGLAAAPDFTLTDTQGNEHSLADFAGKYVVLEWTNPDCPFVKKFYSVGKMQELQKQYTDEGVVWLSIASSAPGKQGHYSADEWNSKIAEHGINATAVLLDADGTVGKAYHATNTPHMFIINPDGKLIYQGAIDDNNSPDPAVIADSHNYVDQVLAAAMTSKTQAYGCGVKY